MMHIFAAAHTVNTPAFSSGTVIAYLLGVISGVLVLTWGRRKG